MRKAFLFVSLMSAALVASAQTRVVAKAVTVEQLQQTLIDLHAQPDAQIAHQIASLVLTERLSDFHCSRIAADLLPGSFSRQALVTLADASKFLDLPKAEIPSTAPPNRESQTAMMAKTREYVIRTIRNLPNFLAERETENFEGTPPASDDDSARFEPLHEVSHSQVVVLYRNNKELTVKARSREMPTKQLHTAGEFGPILVTVFGDAAKGRILWSHWEQGIDGPMAVFRYEVPQPQSHYMVSSASYDHGATRDPAYHGEVAVNPNDGSILRLTVIAELKPDDALTLADLEVDYGPVEIGGRSYLCPLRSIALSRVRTVVQALDFKTDQVQSTSLGDPRLYLNEVLFKQYHVFRGETNMIIGGDPDDTGAVVPASSSN